jgi:hypothetical protein
VALIAYLQRLGTDLFAKPAVPAAPVAVPAKAADATPAAGTTPVSSLTTTGGH